VQDLLPVVDDKEVGEMCGSDRFLKGFEVIGFPKQFFQEVLIMSC
jgi:hypothetical protein